MHVEIRARGKKKKYYLAHSIRKGSKVKKISFYLGSDLSKTELAQKKKHAELIILERIKSQKIIRDPFRIILSEEELNEIKALEAKGKIRIAHLSDADWAKFAQLFTYDTNAIEDSTVTAKEVKDILEKDKLPKKPKYEISETYGVSDAIGYIRTTKEHISLNLIKKLHEIVFKNSKTFAGQYREKGTEVSVIDADGTVVHQGAPSQYITSLLEELETWYGKNRKKYPPFILAAVVHNQFENIHPFQDGNGRVGRLLLNNILIKHNFPPVNIELRNRKEYYSALQEYENGNLRPTIELIIKEYKAMKNSYAV
ncbi:MAG: Fic family protein [Nanoarchaeota archaeon]|nr:Fic family protein [Nanoarchaeota archaeon]MBU4299855.1 Fic family protein [Nanoarchaeota archaeon]MBU4451674.1 Fic family protein [Nanoarchaeota archaeon]MCG2723621.1 Fic family protein [archaeon]